MGSDGKHAITLKPLWLKLHACMYVYMCFILKLPPCTVLLIASYMKRMLHT